jgi:hypothetical protein
MAAHVICDIAKEECTTNPFNAITMQFSELARMYPLLNAERLGLLAPQRNRVCKSRRRLIK